MPTIELSTLVLIISFLVYGTRCLFAEVMIREFQRWGVSGLRHTTGILEVLGASGLVVGQWLPWVGLVSAAGLSLLMMCGLLVRLRIRDSLLQTLPAVIYLIVSLLVTWQFAKIL
ncbi:MAG: hypothetical protein RIS36_709 [Pseudomonadota bacterium]|jgi:hypothetical protein